MQGSLQGKIYISVEAKEWRQRGFCEKFEFIGVLSKHGMWFPESRREEVFRKDET